MAEKCKECGCLCTQCSLDEHNHGDMHLHVEIENLRQRLMERDNHIVTMETHFLNEADKFPNGELASIKEEIVTWQEKYARLYEAHKRVQKVNQNLEDKLLRIVDKCETEKGAFTKDIATLSHRLADANYTIHRLTQDNEKYRNDVNLAIQLLQCKPSNFVGQRYDSLPSEVQAKVRTYVAHKRRPSDTSAPDVKSITVPISTFPPTAMVYNVTKTNAEKDSDDESEESKIPVDIVSASIMAKVLEERERDRIFAKHCDTCTCHRGILTNETETQTTDNVDVYACNICGSENIQNAKELSGNSGENSQSRDNFRYDGSPSKNSEYTESSARHSIFSNLNEKSIGSSQVKLQSNGNSTKNTCFQYVNEKGTLKNVDNLENSIRRDNVSNVGEKGYLSLRNPMRQQGLSNVDDNINARPSNHPTNNQNQNDNSNSNNYHSTESPIKQATFKNANDKPTGKMMIEKSRQVRSVKRPDSQIGTKSKACDWSKIDRNASQTNLVVSKTDETPQPQKIKSPVDVINDRLRKNEWSKSKLNLADVTTDSQRKMGGDSQIDVINDRVWRNERSRLENSKPPQLTLIEVKTADLSMNQSDSRQTEDTASPSFSSDSVVISTSDPPSSSSDPMQVVNQKQFNYNNNLKSSWQDRTMGPRGCSMRVTAGSKNILLDNAGHYQTILYTSGNSRPNTALVHTAKSSRSGRSTSTSSEENSPILPHDNAQLQRVAEWIQASGPTDNAASQKQSNAKSIDTSVLNRTRNPKANEKLLNRAQNTPSIRMKDSKLKCDKSDFNSTNDAQNKPGGHEETRRSVGEVEMRVASDTSCIDNAKSTSQLIGDSDVLKPEEDLISFEPSNDEKIMNVVDVSSKPDSILVANCEIKVTREMEETYLKLAASLDPGNLSLSRRDSTDITIEKYRRDHKRLYNQKNQENTESAT